VAKAYRHHPLRIKAVTIDLDGTLADSVPDLAAAANAMLRAQQAAWYSACPTATTKDGMCGRST